MIVSFSGNDGSGKTTIAKEFAKTLEKAGFKVRYRQEFNYFLLKYLLMLFPKKLVHKKRSDFVHSHSASKHSLLQRIWVYFVWVDCLLEQIYLRIIDHNKVLVTDRYAHDFLMSFEYLNLSNTFVRILFGLIPQAHVSFIFIVDPEIAYQRKKHDHNNEMQFYEIQRDRYKNYARKHNIACIETGGTLSVTMDIVWSSWREKIKPKALQDNNVDQACINNALEEVVVEDETLCTVLDRYDEKIKHTIAKWETIAEKHNIPYAYIKTYNPFVSPITDLDIMVPHDRYDEVSALLHKDLESHTGFAHKAETFESTKTIPIDLHFEVSWHLHRVFSDQEILHNRIQREFYGQEVSTPYAEIDLLVWSAHSLMQHHYTTWGEYKIMAFLLQEIVKLEHDMWQKPEYRWLKNEIVTRHNMLYPEKPLMHRQKMLKVKTPVMTFWHPLWTMRVHTFWQLIDVVLYCYRYIRFRFTGILPYNTNWLNDEKALAR